MSGQIIEFPVILLEAATGKVVGECALSSLVRAGYQRTVEAHHAAKTH